MLKIAYHLGVQQALQEEDLERLVKEAAELGIDLEKLAIPGLGAIGQGLATGAKALGSGLRAGGKGVWEGLKGGLANTKGFGLANRASLAARGAGAGAAKAWQGMSPLQRKMLMGTGGGALLAM